MTDYERSTRVRAPRDDLFEFLSRLDSLPKYMARMTQVRHFRGDEVYVTAKIGDREVTGEGWFRIDADARTIRWGAEGTNNYHGELSVVADGELSRVTVRLHTEREVEPGSVEQGIEQTLDDVRRLMEQPAQ